MLPINMLLTPVESDITLRVNKLTPYADESHIAYSSFIFFFFQAEDGIRDYKVTGVQTCALPIFKTVFVTGGDRDARDEGGGPVALGRVLGGSEPPPPAPARSRIDIDLASLKIGRASCRERV